LSAGPEFLRRSRLEIMHSILSLCLQGERSSARKTHIMYKCNLSFKQLGKYLETMTDLGLLEVNRGSYSVTEKGKRFLEEFQGLKRLLQ